MRTRRSALNIFEATLPSNITRPAEFNVDVMRINAIEINDRNIRGLQDHTGYCRWSHSTILIFGIPPGKVLVQFAGFWWGERPREPPRQYSPHQTLPLRRAITALPSLARMLVLGCERSSKRTFGYSFGDEPAGGSQQSGHEKDRDRHRGGESK